MDTQAPIVHRPGITGVRIVLSLAAGSAGVSFLTLIGYAIGNPRFGVMPDQQAMSLCTAELCLALAGAVWADVRRRFIALRWTAAGVLTVSLGVLLSWLTLGQDAINPLLLNYFGNSNFPNPPRTSVAAATCCALLSIGCCTRPRRQPAAILACFAMLISSFTLLGYAYGIEDFHTLLPLGTFSLRAAFSIFALGTVLLLSNHEAGVGDLILATSVTGRATRRQLSFLVLPPMIGFGLLQMTSANRLDQQQPWPCWSGSP